MVTSNVINANTAGVVTYSGAGVFTGSAVTQHGVVVGGASNTVATVAVGGTNSVLLGATGANPTWSSYTLPSSPDAYAVVTTDTNGNITDIVPFNVGSIVIGVNFSGTTGPAWSNSLWPFSTTANQILYSCATNTVAGLSTLDNGVLITSASGVPELLANGTAGYVLTAQSGAPPHWAASSGGIGTLSADNSGTATGSTVLISGSSTGLTTTASGSTVGLTGTLVVGNGGTGEASFTAYSVVAGGTTTTAHLQSVSVGGATAGQVLTYVSSSALPTWQNATGGIATLNADSGSATGSTVTISGGSTGLTTTASSATLDLTGTLVVGNGGTGNTTFTAYSVVCAGTTSTGVFQNVSGVGSSGQVLTSNGASALPTWQAANSTLAVTSTVISSASPYTVLSTDQFIPTDTTSGTITIKLPNGPTTGRVIIIKDKTGEWATNNLTLTTVGGSVTIDGLTSYIGATAYQSITVIFDGSNYEVM